MVTPFSLLASRFTVSPRGLRWATTAALIVSILIVLFGGVVRVTGSGLGCPSWPSCEITSLAPTPALGIHGVIEFANRLFTGAIVIAVGWVIVAARLQKPRDRSITRLAWSQFWLVVANAVAGGITVLTGLNPWVVALHFMMAVALLTTTTLTWHRVHERRPDVPARPSPAVAGLSWALAAATLALVVVGTLVSGSGPHSGDSADVPRMGFQWAGITVFHGVVGTLVLVLALALGLAARGASSTLLRRRVLAFLVVVLFQGAVGVIQALNGLPEILVAIHLLGAALVWVGVLRLLLEANPTLFRGTAVLRDDSEPALVSA
jgi:cytochrome c oxidase assembly protein subunit 15